MDDTQENYRVPDTKPTRPGKLAILGLLGIAVGFFAIILIAPDKEIEARKAGAIPPAAATQSEQP